MVATGRSILRSPSQRLRKSVLSLAVGALPLRARSADVTGWNKWRSYDRMGGVAVLRRWPQVVVIRNTRPNGQWSAHPFYPGLAVSLDFGAVSLRQVWPWFLFRARRRDAVGTRSLRSSGVPHEVGRMGLLPTRVSCRPLLAVTSRYIRQRKSMPWKKTWMNPLTLPKS